MDRQRPEGTNTSSVERVLCLDESNGKPVWTYVYPCEYTISYPAGPRVTPLVHDGKVVTLGAQGHLLCLDTTKGKLVWSHDLTQEYRVKAPPWGFAAHPCWRGTKWLCLVGGAGTSAVAFDFQTGKEVWRALTAREPGYSPPAICEFGGKRSVIIWHPKQSTRGPGNRTRRVVGSFRIPAGSECVYTPAK